MANPPRTVSPVLPIQTSSLDAPRDGLRVQNMSPSGQEPIGTIDPTGVLDGSIAAGLFKLPTVELACEAGRTCGGGSCDGPTCSALTCGSTCSNSCNETCSNSCIVTCNSATDCGKSCVLTCDRATQGPPTMMEYGCEAGGTAPSISKTTIVDGGISSKPEIVLSGGRNRWRLPKKFTKFYERIQLFLPKTRFGISRFIRRVRTLGGKSIFHPPLKIFNHLQPQLYLS